MYGAESAGADLEGGMRIATSVFSCQRCGHNHTEVEFSPLTNPRDEWTHWAFCPVTLQPILMRVLESTVELPPPTDPPAPE